jgi:quercetin dioxygenase-like cupin family protein
VHFDQDEWIYVIDGELEFQIGDKRLRAGAGESVFLPRNVTHGWACVNGKPGKITQGSAIRGERFGIALIEWHGDDRREFED